MLVFCFRKSSVPVEQDASKQGAHAPVGLDRFAARITLRHEGSGSEKDLVEDTETATDSRTAKAHKH